jgi:hypothetical protein
MMRQLMIGAALIGTAVAVPRCGCHARTAYADPGESRKLECPDFVRDAKLAMRDVTGGVELRITTPWTIHLTPLRKMLHNLALVVEEYTHRDEPRDGEMEIPPIAIVVREVTAGSLITVRADESANVPVLREQAKLLREFWSASACINGKPGQVAMR